MQLNGKPLEDYSIVELKEIQNQSQEILEQRIVDEEKMALEYIAELIRTHKLTYAKVMRTLREENAIIAPLDGEGYACPIYYNPNNPTEVYDGQGRRPHWVKKLTNSGDKLSNHIINKDDKFNPNIE